MKKNLEILSEMRGYITTNLAVSTLLVIVILSAIFQQVDLSFVLKGIIGVFSIIVVFAEVFLRAIHKHNTQIVLSRLGKFEVGDTVTCKEWARQFLGLFNKDLDVPPGTSGTIIKDGKLMEVIEKGKENEKDYYYEVLFEWVSPKGKQRKFTALLWQERLTKV